MRKKAEWMEVQKEEAFDYVSEEIAQIAENLCRPLYGSMDDLDGILPHIAQALMNYKKQVT